MTDIEERLNRAGAQFRESPVPAVAVRWPAEKRRGWAAPVAIAAAVALIVAGVAIAVSVGREDAAPPAAPALQTDREYAVGAPYVGGTGGPGLPPPKTCSMPPMTATATTRASGDGVVGLLTMDTKTGCALVVNPSSLGLVNAQQRPLGVPTSKGNVTNPIHLRSEFAENAGHVRMGFAWSGSWCGPPAKWIAVTVNSNTAVLVALNGPAPACHGTSSSVLIPGVVGGPGDAVVPPPVSWKALSAKVILPGAVGQGPIPLTVVLTNSSKEPVSFASPCPTYATLVSLDVHGSISEIGGTAVSEAARSLGFPPVGALCQRAFVVQPGQPLTLHLPALEFPAFSDVPRTKVSSGDPVTVTFSIAGIPPATATTHIR